VYFIEKQPSASVNPVTQYGLSIVFLLLILIVLKSLKNEKGIDLITEK